MLRITEKIDDQNILRVQLDGRIDSESFTELEAIWMRPGERKATTLVLDMTGVLYMSDEAARKLTDLRGDSFQIVNCSPFIAMLLEKNSSEIGEQ